MLSRMAEGLLGEGEEGLEHKNGGTGKFPHGTKARLHQKRRSN